MMDGGERLARMALCALQITADPQLAHLVEIHGASEVWEAGLRPWIQQSWRPRPLT